MFEKINENINLFKNLTNEQKIEYIDYLKMNEMFKNNTVECP